MRAWHAGPQAQPGCGLGVARRQGPKPRRRLPQAAPCGLTFPGHPPRRSPTTDLAALLHRL